MLDDKTFKNVAFNLSQNPNNYMSSFRENLFRFGATKQLTIEECANRAGIPMNTLVSLLYKDEKDCKLSTAVSLARALNISVDELVGCGTMVPAQRESLAMLRLLPNRFTIWIRWVIRKNFKSESTDTIILPNCNYDYEITLRKEKIE